MFLSGNSYFSFLFLNFRNTIRICLNVCLFTFILLELSECFWSNSSSLLLRVVFLYCVFIIAFSSMVFGLPLELLLFTIRLSRTALWFFFFFFFFHSGIPFLFILSLDSVLNFHLLFQITDLFFRKVSSTFYFLN